MYVSISQSIRPSFFISYSRRQKIIADIIMNALKSGEQDIWYDIDAIALGEDWRREIYEGIVACDELILILSDDSIRSQYVIEECQCAISMGKLIRPIIATPLSARPPKPLDEIQYIDISMLKSERDIAIKLSKLFTLNADVSKTSITWIKLAACRGIWPPFSRELIGEAGMPAALSAASDIEKFRDRYSASSSIWLNGGLLKCIAGNWDMGLDLLRAYAQNAKNFAGWYFLSLHLIRRQHVLRLNLKAAKEALFAIRTAQNFGQNPLSELVATVLEVGADNYGTDHLYAGIEQFLDISKEFIEIPTEYLRVYWCLQPSWPILQDYQRPILEFFRQVTKRK